MAVEGKRAARDGGGWGPYKEVMVWVCGDGYTNLYMC